MARIQISNVEKDYGNVTVLKDCNLDIAHGEFIVLVGPSGSGKTTLLRMIAGLESISRGDMMFDDRRVNDVDVGDRNIAMVFQNYGLYPHMSVYDNMAFGLRRRKLSKTEIDGKVKRIATLLSLDGLLERRPKQLSGGQRQRVALGRAIIRDPEVFLLDEPLSNLDAQLRVQMRSEIMNVHRSVDATAVYVTHDQVEAMTMGDRIAVMNNGEIQQIGTPEDLYDRPQNLFVATFIGTPSMGILRCDVDRDGSLLLVRDTEDRIAISRGQLDRIGDRREVLAGIRPEHLHLPRNGAPAVIRGEIDVVEMLGSEQYLYLRNGAANFIARMERGHHFRPGETVGLDIDTEALHLFDSDTEEAL
ncbi:ABC transporter ATP-binding protein [Paracoccus onubensis]|uniref:sn-glycerol-3-phosphate ABC transporter ATP-binding protein UgpC n=1 Tax=Paracoccus onubensis TaxID=1675788 RepID=A0A418T7H0_9RHOB|nr:sn-glycerol-3-phosphate ABC transporter ATP-binding protein UgpC [Paracoccus onubensis]RJE89123.1 sn-glycerol-3-phosphate ABC transporter ATP-binding protein UgpC [Paracoccus onubensis]